MKFLRRWLSGTPDQRELVEGRLDELVERDAQAASGRGQTASGEAQQLDWRQEFLGKLGELPHFAVFSMDAQGIHTLDFEFAGKSDTPAATRDFRQDEVRVEVKDGLKHSGHIKLFEGASRLEETLETFLTHIKQLPEPVYAELAHKEVLFQSPLEAPENLGPLGKIKPPQT